MNFPIADAHTDYLSNLVDKTSFMDSDLQTQYHLSLPALLRGQVEIQVFALFVDREKPVSPAVQCLNMIDQYQRLKLAWKNKLVDFDAALPPILPSGRVHGILSIEGGEALSGSLALLRCYYRLGVRMMGLLWNYENEIGYPAVSGSKQGLKPFGFSVIQEMNRLHMAIDVSHLNEAGFYDALEASSEPLCASHSNSDSLCHHPRNLKKDQILALIQGHGFIGLNFFSDFLSSSAESTITDILRHAEDILSLGGEDVLGFGSDFEGIDRWPKGISGAQDFPKIIDRFLQAGYSERLVRKIAYQNFYRYISPFFSAGLSD